MKSFLVEILFQYFSYQYVIKWVVELTKHCWFCFFDKFHIELSPFKNFLRKKCKFENLIVYAYHQYLSLSHMNYVEIHTFISTYFDASAADSL